MFNSQVSLIHLSRCSFILAHLVDTEKSVCIGIDFLFENLIFVGYYNF